MDALSNALLSNDHKLDDSEMGVVVAETNMYFIFIYSFRIG